MSIKCTNIDEMVDATKKLLEDKELRNEMVASQAKYINKNASDDIADTVIKLIQRS